MIYATHDKLGNAYRLKPIFGRNGYWQLMQNDIGEGETGTLDYFLKHNDYKEFESELDYQIYKGNVRCV